MENYSLYHARNELAHNNQMMLQASGTLCLWVIYKEISNLEDFLTATNAICFQNAIAITHLKVEQGTAEELQHILLETELDDISILVLSFCPIGEFNFLDEFIGQEYILTLQKNALEIPALQLEFDLSANNNANSWETWLMENIPSHQTEYYDPDITQ